MSNAECHVYIVDVRVMWFVVYVVGKMAQDLEMV